MEPENSSPENDKSTKRPNTKKGTSLLDRKNIQEKNALEIEDRTICFICANKSKYWAVGECNHHCCTVCSLRLRSLYKSNSCPYCKAELSEVYYISDNTRTFSQLKDIDKEFFDEEIGFVCEKKVIFDDCYRILSFSCPVRNCRYVDDDGWDGLRLHISKTHNMFLCDLCIEHKKVFPFEHSVFYPGGLRRHYKTGNNLDFNGHPECGFCRISFYDSDMLYDHCRKNHEQCFICQKSGVQNHAYYKNYISLVEHFESDHYPCRHPSCLDRKFVVFKSDIDLKAHELEEHGKNIIGQRAKWEAKKVPIQLVYSSYNGPETSGRNNSSRGESSNRKNQSSETRNKVSQTVPSSNVVSSTESNDANSSLQSSKKIGKGPEPQNKLEQTENKQTIDEEKFKPKPKGYGKLTTSGTVPSGNTSSPPPALDPLTVKAHSELLNKVSSILNNNQPKIENFRKFTTQLKKSEITGKQYVEQLSSTLFKNEKDLNYVVKTISDLIKDENITSDLLSGLRNDYIKRRQFPGLVPMPFENTKSGKAPQVPSPRSGWISTVSAVSTSSPKNNFPKLGSTIPSTLVKEKVHKQPIQTNGYSSVAGKKSLAKDKVQTWSKLTLENPQETPAVLVDQFPKLSLAEDRPVIPPVAKNSGVKKQTNYGKNAWFSETEQASGKQNNSSTNANRNQNNKPSTSKNNKKAGKNVVLRLV
ncbi:hypothetical protein BB558_004844 [Smittium angustum]|uniref:RING-type E3 ubiquitin transferase n=1 Tax=Smittium angustum TaxID=133377 RepID=A0A2U1J2B5_SMIAN|nr:hypothetical protein BB558_004844 [Smittium angustum]